MSTYGSGAPRDVVTGEAVALELRLAQLPTRALAIMLDMAIQVGVLLLLLLLVGVSGTSLDSAAAAAVSLVVVVGVLVGYPLLMETLTRGKTVGKYALGVRAVRDDGGAIRFRQALARALIEVVEIWLLLGIPAVFCSLANSKGKRLGDLAAGTVVVRERAPAEAGSRAMMPPELMAWAAVADVGRVPDDLALAARQFLVRAPELDRNVRWTMSQRLAADVVPWLSPPPPPGSPERLLAAVVSERRRREEHRMASQVAAARAWASSATTPPPVAAPAPPTSGNDAYGLRPGPPVPPPAATDGPATDGDGFTAPS